jgi:Zn finger protein HypA/HybF involved in hydrogenase expression
MDQLFEHVGLLQEAPVELSVQTLCAACEEPAAVVHHDEVGYLCEGCKRAALLVREHLRAERQEVTRRRLVLAAEGIAGYGG